MTDRPPRLPEQLRALGANIANFYAADTAEARELRAAHLTAVLKLTPVTMAANIGCAAMLLLAFRPAVPGALWVGCLAVGVLVAVGLTGWWRQRERSPERASRRAMRHATAHAALLAAVWGAIVAATFPGATPDQQLMIASLVTGAVGAGGFVLSPLPHASLAWIGGYTVGACAALWLDTGPDLYGVAFMLLLFSATVQAGALSLWRKSTALIRSEAAAARQERLVAMLLHDFEGQANEALWEVDAAGRLRHVSERLAQLLGSNAEALRGMALVEALEPQARGGTAELRQALAAGRPFTDLRLPLERAGGRCVLAFSGKPLLDEAGRPLGWRGVGADVTEKVSSEELLREMAHTDFLTGLANRFTFRDALAEALRRRSPLAVLAIDLDHFKSINDTFGHQTGDAVLISVAERLRRQLRPTDLVARLGGDEFALLLRPLPAPGDLAALAQRLVGALVEPLDVGGRRLRAGASIGVAPLADDLHDADDLLVQADMALYAAKAAGRGRYVVYSPALGDRQRRRLAIEQGLRHALERNELALHWQPKVDLAGGGIAGVEALMRWTSPQLGVVSPSEFIVVAEQCGLIGELGAWALHQACRTAAGPLAGLTVSVNVSPLQLHGPGFVVGTLQALQAAGLPPARLEIEITESVFMDDPQGALAQLHELRALGVRIALDDFGTGYSSLAYLRQFPFDTLKVDRSFVHEIPVRDDARAIVQAIAQLAARLRMRTVCEGVETQAQLDAVRAAGCDEAQGYLFAEPRPLAAVLALVERWQPAGEQGSLPLPAPTLH